ncbi:hypothetical protein OUZ56_002076 [Daphnia magna]|uniref:Uncharacterized protein n=1 Tax=Daphnia magna TaxID=35525 RepID=A0ABR0A536_9CRUS|nr:hypothetical protein OUZ56_002076 [Daphnia magna]
MKAKRRWRRADALKQRRSTEPESRMTCSQSAPPCSRDPRSGGRTLYYNRMPALLTSTQTA